MQYIYLYFKYLNVPSKVSQLSEFTNVLEPPRLLE